MVRNMGCAAVADWVYFVGCDRWSFFLYSEFEAFAADWFRGCFAVLPFFLRFFFLQSRVLSTQLLFRRGWVLLCFALPCVLDREIVVCGPWKEVF